MMYDHRLPPICRVGCSADFTDSINSTLPAGSLYKVKQFFVSDHRSFQTSEKNVMNFCMYIRLGYWCPNGGLVTRVVWNLVTSFLSICAGHILRSVEEKHV